MTFYETGMRLSELVGLDDEAISFVNHEIKITGKGNKQRIVPFGNELDETLQAYIRLRNQTVESQSPALFLSDKGKRMTSAKVREIVEGVLVKSMLVEKEKSTRLETYICYGDAES